MPSKVFRKLFRKFLKKKKNNSYSDLNKKTKEFNDPRSPKKKRTPVPLVN